MGRDFESGQFKIPVTEQEPAIQEKKPVSSPTPEVAPMSAFDMRGYWPEMIGMFKRLVAKEEGAGFFERRKIEKFLRAHADDTFEKAATEFERLPASLRTDGPEDKKQFEKIFFGYLILHCKNQIFCGTAKLDQRHSKHFSSRVKKW